MKTTLTLTCAVLLLSICQGAIRSKVGSCEKMLMDAQTNVAQQEGQSICQYNKDGLLAFGQALSSCQDTSKALIQEWVMATIWDIELVETKEADCDVDTTVLQPFLTTENRAIVVAANQLLEGVSSEMLTCIQKPMTQMEKDLIALLRKKENGACISGIASWSTMASNAVKCAKAAGATVSCADESALYKLGALNINLYTKLITDFPEKCEM